MCLELVQVQAECHARHNGIGTRTRGWKGLPGKHATKRGGGGRVKDTVLSCAWGGMEELGKKGKKIATLGEIFVPL